MHPGIPVDRLAELVVQQHTQHRDFIAPAQRLRVISSEHGSTVNFDVGSDQIKADLTPHALRQLGAYGDIPMRYLDKLQGEPELLDQNLNQWLSRSSEPRMLRTLIGSKQIARAFLSSKYRPLDNYELLSRAMPKLRAGGVEIKSCALTEQRLFVQAVSSRLTREVKAGDVVQAGMVLSNSEVGSGSLRIEPMVYRLVCTNGLISGTSLRKYHVGRGFSNGDDSHEVFSDKTKAIADEAFWAQVSDVIDAAMSEMHFAKLVDRLTMAANTSVGKDPAHVVEVTATNFGLTQDEKDAMVRHLFEGGDLSLYGVMNAVTRAAQDVELYDRAIELERIGGQILEVNPAIYSRN